MAHFIHASERGMPKHDVILDEEITPKCMRRCFLLHPETLSFFSFCQNTFTGMVHCCQTHLAEKKDLQCNT